jgi:protein-L-isoaspartate(D-aspartate) O-methyltransferase
MTDFVRARRTMVDTQIRPSDVTDTRVLDAFLETPREAFLPAETRALAYLDLDIVVKAGRPPRCLMQPMVLARLLQAANISAGDRILDVGSATGYSAAVLSWLGRHVVALECEADLAGFARRALADRANASLAEGSLEAGHAAAAPYDVIVMQGAIEDVPSGLTAQLADGGRLVGVVGYGRAGRATVFVRSGTDVAGRIVFDTTAAPLPGFARAAAFAF